MKKKRARPPTKEEMDAVFQSIRERDKKTYGHLPVWEPPHMLHGADGKPVELSQEHRLAIEKARTEREQWMKPDVILKGMRIEYDAATNTLTAGNKSESFKKGSNQDILCQIVFASDAKRGEWIRETDVVEKFYKGDRSNRSFYDAIRAVNKILSKLTGVEEVLQYDAARVRIRTELFE